MESNKIMNLRVFWLLLCVAVSNILLSCSNDIEESDIDPVSEVTSLPPMNDPEDVCSSMKDAKLMAYCYKNFDINNDKKVSVTEASVVKVFDSDMQGIEDMTGIQYFTSLKKVVPNGCYFTEIDLTHCQELEVLRLDAPLINVDVSRNRKLKSIELSNGDFTSINVSQCDSLEDLILSSPLSGIDVSSLKSLKKLELNGTKIESIDISRNERLYRLAIIDTLISSIDLSNHGSLTSLKLSCPKITSLDVKSCPNLNYLELRGLGISRLDISKVNGLTSAYFYDMPKLSEIIMQPHHYHQIINIKDISSTIIFVDQNGNEVYPTVKVSYNLDVVFGGWGLMKAIKIQTALSNGKETVEYDYRPSPPENIIVGGVYNGAFNYLDGNYVTLASSSLPAEYTFALSIEDGFDDSGIDIGEFSYLSISIGGSYSVEFANGITISSKNFACMKETPQYSYGRYDKEQFSNYITEIEQSLCNTVLSFDARGNLLTELIEKQ